MFIFHSLNLSYLKNWLILALSLIYLKISHLKVMKKQHMKKLKYLLLILHQNLFQALNLILKLNLNLNIRMIFHLIMKKVKIWKLNPIDKFIGSIEDRVKTRSQATTNFCFFTNFLSIDGTQERWWSLERWRQGWRYAIRINRVWEEWSLETCSYTRRKTYNWNKVSVQKQNGKNGVVIRNKARLVAQGYKHKKALTMTKHLHLLPELKLSDFTKLMQLTKISKYKRWI